MKVINEASIGLNKINDLNKNLENATSDEEINKAVDDIFETRSGLNDKLKNNIKSLGLDFLKKWLSAMRIDEFVRDNNEFSEILEDNDLNSTLTKNTEVFTKAYNAYASNLFDNPESDMFQKKLLADSSIYGLDENDFKDMFKIYNKIKSENKDLSPRDIYNKANDYFYDRGTGQLKSTAEIENRPENDLDQEKIQKAIEKYSENGHVSADKLADFVNYLRNNNLEIRSK